MLYKLIFESVCKILNNGHFKILEKECSGRGEGIDLEVFVLVAIKACLLKVKIFSILLFTCL